MYLKNSRVDSRGAVVVAVIAAVVATAADGSVELGYMYEAYSIPKEGWEG